MLILLMLLLADGVQQENLNDFRWLEGLWQNTSTPNTYEEWWWNSDKKQMEGRGYRVMTRDTLLFETLSIRWHNGSVHYIPIIEENVGPVPFKITQHNGKGFECVNTKHDFPKMIIYQNKGNKMVAAITGNGKKQEFSFRKLR